MEDFAIASRSATKIYRRHECKLCWTDIVNGRQKQVPREPAKLPAAKKPRPVAPDAWGLMNLLVIRDETVA